MLRYGLVRVGRGSSVAMGRHQSLKETRDALVALTPLEVVIYK